MAGDWLKMEANTPEKEEVLSITTIMGWEDPDMTVGKLFRLWRWFDQQTTDGNASRVTFALLDRIVGVSGFCSAVHDVGWLVSTDSGVSLPKFDRHNGSSAKSRAQTAKRVANHKTNGKGNANGNAATVTEALPREEKRREEKSNSVTNVTGDKSPTDRDMLFATGVPLLTASGVSDKNARSMLAGLAKKHGDSVVVEAIRQTAIDRPVEPVSWLQSLMPSMTNGKPNAQEALEASNRAVVERYFKNKATHAPQ